MSTNFLRHPQLPVVLGAVGALLIIGLLWAIGAIAAGQVERAQARNEQPAPVHMAATRCGPEQLPPCPPFDAADAKPVPVRYR